jgi:hypothetical protein
MAKADDERAKRLAEALRQNLRRRKAQARGEESPISRCPIRIEPRADRATPIEAYLAFDVRVRVDRRKTGSDRPALVAKPFAGLAV